MAIRYTIPSFMPFADTCPSSPSNTALHMAHYPNIASVTKNKTIRNIYLNFITSNKEISLYKLLHQSLRRKATMGK